MTNEGYRGGGDDERAPIFLSMIGGMRNSGFGIGDADDWGRSMQITKLGVFARNYIAKPECI